MCRRRCVRTRALARACGFMQCVHARMYTPACFVYVGGAHKCVSVGRWLLASPVTLGGKGKRIRVVGWA